MDNSTNLTVDPATVTKSDVVTKIRLTIPHFFLNATTMDVFVGMFTADDKFVDNRMIHVPEDIYKEWGNDDNYIIDYVVSQLKLHLQTAPATTPTES